MKYLIVDGHCDSILDVAQGVRKLSIPSNKGQLDFPRLQGRVNLQFMALFIESVFKPHNSLLRTLELIDLLKQEMSATDYVSPILTKNDINEFPDNYVKTIMAIEGGEALSGSINVLRCFFDLGIRSITLTWNQRNQIADGCGEEPTTNGLSKFGREVIQEMNKLGMLVDVSHLAEKGFWDVIELSEKPIVASHSCCQEICPHPRNLSDRQLKALAANGGVMGINFYPFFLKGDGSSVTIKDVIKHVIHASEIMGTEHVGLGSDFDGIDSLPEGLGNVTKLPLLISELEKAGFTSGDIANIMGNSFLTVLKKVLPDD